MTRRTALPALPDTPTPACFRQSREKSNGASGTIYWYAAGAGIIAESDLNGIIQHEYIFFGGQRIARKDLPGNAVSYYYSDHLKRASVITDATGTIKADSDYYPFGDLQFVNNDANEYKFTGQKRDAKSGLDYFGARYYSSAISRFMTPDWSAAPSTVPYAHLDNPQTLNLYSYVDNNPINGIDADGHTFESMVAGGAWGPNIFQNALSGTPKPNDDQAPASIPVTVVTEKTSGTPITLDKGAGVTETLTPGSVTTKTYDVNGNFLGGNVQAVIDVTDTKNGQITYQKQGVPMGEAKNLISDPTPNLQNQLAGDGVRFATGAAAAFLDPKGSLLHNSGEVVAKHMDEHGITFGFINELNMLPWHIAGALAEKGLDKVFDTVMSLKAPNLCGENGLGSCSH
ncbi:MAG: RHS repeat-associated core domain-containing protein [Candidatus Angelobacter sp.]